MWPVPTSMVPLHPGHWYCLRAWKGWMRRTSTVSSSHVPWSKTTETPQHQSDHAHHRRGDDHVVRVGAAVRAVGVEAHGPIFARSACFLGLDESDLVDTGLVSATLELGGEEHVDDGDRQRLAEHPGPERQNVCIVVQAGEPCGELVVAQGGPNAADLVRGNGLTLAASTHHDGEVRFASYDAAPCGGTEVWIVDRTVVGGSEIDHDVAQRDQMSTHGLLEVKSGMVRGKGDLHLTILPGFDRRCHVVPPG